MKRVLLIVGLFGCYTVSAQQKDIFDIQNHLEKKSKKAHLEVNLKVNSKVHNLKTFDFNSHSLPQFQFTLSNGDKVISLPTDNMPCVVPDMKQFKRMPDAGIYYKNRLPGLSPNGRYPGEIPNAAAPFRFTAMNK
ncbi:MAG: hypothetical protein WBC06_16850 [Chitinophagaceae bacterium]